MEALISSLRSFILTLLFERSFMVLDRQKLF
jgi:hypothetical protein